MRSLDHLACRRIQASYSIKYASQNANHLKLDLQYLKPILIILMTVPTLATCGSNQKRQTLHHISGMPPQMQVQRHCKQRNADQESVPGDERQYGHEHRKRNNQPEASYDCCPATISTPFASPSQAQGTDLTWTF